MKKFNWVKCNCKKDCLGKMLKINDFNFTLHKNILITPWGTFHPPVEGLADVLIRDEIKKWTCKTEIVIAELRRYL